MGGSYCACAIYNTLWVGLEQLLFLHSTHRLLFTTKILRYLHRKLAGSRATATRADHYTHSHTRIYVHYLYVRTYTQARKPSKMAAAVSRRDGALLASLLALFLGASCLPTDVDLIGFSRAILAMTNDTLGAGLMQVEIASCILIYIGRVCCVST